MSQQQQLPFGTAEGAYAERKALLWVALRECGASPGLIRFCEWLFDATGGGIGVAITATYRELATKPWLLNCSRSTLKRIVAEGVATGLVVAEETWDGVGRPTGSRYSISRDRVRELITRTSGQPVPPKDEPVRVQNEPLSVQIEPLRVQIEPINRGAADVATAGLIPGGETPRGRAGAPSFVPSLRPTTTSERTDVSWKEISSLGREAKRLLYPGSASQIAHGDRKHWTIARLAYLALVQYGREWLLEGIQTAGKRKPRDLSYAKGVLANLSGNRAEFFAQFDSLQSDAPWYQPGRTEADDG